jgi:hypothetical protein
LLSLHLGLNWVSAKRIKRSLRRQSTHPNGGREEILEALLDLVGERQLGAVRLVLEGALHAALAEVLQRGDALVHANRVHEAVHREEEPMV